MNPTEQTITQIIAKLDDQAGRIMSHAIQVKDGIHVSNSLLRKIIALRDSLTALQHIASWSDQATTPSALDEPHSTVTARETLKKIAKLYEN